MFSCSKTLCFVDQNDNVVGVVGAVDIVGVGGVDVCGVSHAIIHKLIRYI